MKSIFKFMTVALAAGLVVSCSDDLNLEQKAALHAEKGDLVGTLYSETTTRVAILDEMNETGYPAVWSDDDDVNVFSSTRLNFNQYTLKEGAGTNQAVFQPIEEDPTLLAANDLYAITEASYQYGVSAVDANSGKVKLTAEIPCSFDWEKLATTEAYKLPSPYWGNASFGSDGVLNVGFRPLTAVLRLDLALLPEGVQAIVLVSGNSMFPGANYKVNGISYTGTGEGLSGHFNAELDSKTADVPALGIDKALVCYDTLRVDLPEATEAGEDKVLYLPLIAQHYDDLKVIAVMEDDVMPYTWYGEILKVFTDQTIVNGKTYNVAQTAEIEIASTSAKEISELIAQTYDGKHSLIVSVPNLRLTSDDNTIYIVSDDKTSVGNTDVTINFPYSANLSGLNIVEASANNKVGADFIRFNMGSVQEADFEEMQEGEEPNVLSEKARRKVTLNFEGNVRGAVNITLPTSNVIMTSSRMINELNIVTANTYNVSGWDANSVKMESNEQNAALKFTGVYGTVNYWSGATTDGKYYGGAVYFLDENSEIYESLNIFGQNPYALRITDALVNTITYPTLGNNPTTYIFTTGSAAIKHLKEDGNKVKIKAYWTGKRLTYRAVHEGYEGSEVYDEYYGINAEKAGVIYTAAQLQGMGLAEDKYEYTISPKTESIWLGGIDWPWIGAEIERLDDYEYVSWYTPSGRSGSDYYQDYEQTYLTQYMYRTGSGEKIEKAFKLDGRNVELKNMILDIYDPNIELPGCCGTTQKVRLLQNLGLIRSIRTEKTVDIFNIQLDDVLLDTHGFAIDNVGSLVGIIDAEEDVNIGGRKDEETFSNFTDIRIISKGNNIGGIVGELECAAAVTINKVKVESIENNNTYIHGGHIQGKSNVGGLVGRLTYDEAYDGVDPTFAETIYKTEAKGYEKLTHGKNNTGYWVTSKHGNIKDHTQDGGYGKQDFFTRKTVVNPDGTRTYEFIQVPAESDFPVAGVTYYAFFDGSDVIQEVGTVTAGTDDSYKLSGSSDNYNDQNVKTETKTANFPIITGTAPEDTWSYEGVKIKDASGNFVDPETTLNKDNLPLENVDYYYDFGTNKAVVDRDASTENDYPTALTIQNAEVRLTPKTESGIILGEKGNNVGGMIGDVLMNGSANVHTVVHVIVPTISATTPEIATKVNAAETKFGNNVGGLIGRFTDLTNKQSSNFAGGIHCSKGITGDGQRVGGVLGLQQVASTETTNELNQVTIGNAATLLLNVGELRAENGWAGGLVGLQEEGSLLINGKAGNTVTVNINTVLKGANCLGGMVGENNGVTIISNESKNSVTIADAAITKTAPYYVRTDAGQENQEGSLYLGTVGTLVGQKNATLKVQKTSNLTVSPEGFSDKKKDQLLFGLHGSAATTEVTPNSYKYWGDHNNGYVGYAKMTANYSVDGTQQGNYQFNVEMEY